MTLVPEFLEITGVSICRIDVVEISDLVATCFRAFLD